MRYHVLATDYDGTLARHGHVAEPVWEAIRRVRESGRKVVMVTGRELEELQQICPHLELFTRVVAENGALLYDPKTKEIKTLSEPPPPEFAASLRVHGVTPLAVGHVIVATLKPHETTVLNTINELGLELQVIFNQESVMVLPSGVNKATGLTIALKELGYSPHNTVGIGDAENDHALLSACECGVAVGNGVPALRERADFVTRGHEGAAVIELIDHILADDLDSVTVRIRRHDLLLGTKTDGSKECLPAFGKNILVAGRSGTGKSVLAAGLLERIVGGRYQYAVIDPEGDYLASPSAVVLGSAERAPLIEEVANVLKSGRNAVVNLLGVALSERPAFFNQLFPSLLELRGRIGHPHWILIDEAHHLMPAAWTPDRIAQRIQGTVSITVHPASISPSMLRQVDLFLALGPEPDKYLAEFCTARGIRVPFATSNELEGGEALAYWVGSDRPTFKLMTLQPKAEQRRHRRKYAEGRLPAERNFVFRGPNGQFRLRAYNLMTFLELATGVDDATWLHHLSAKEYSKWFRVAIKDDELAKEAEAVEAKFAKDPAASRDAIRKAIESRYTLPADAPSGTA